MATNEASLISAVVKNKDIHTVLKEEPDLFGPYADVFSFLKDYYYKYKAVPEQALLTTQFRDLELTDTTAPTQFYLDNVRNNYVRSRLEKIMMKAAEALEKGSPPEVVSRLQTSLSKLSRYTATARDLDITDAEAATEYFKKVRELAEAKGGTPGISTGFASIDSAYPTGMSGGHSIVVLGYTGRAKSMWVDLLATNVWAQGYKPMIISMEMTPEEQRDRIYALMGKGMFRISDLSRGAVSLDDFGSWSKRKFDDAAPFVVVSNEGLVDITPNVVQGKIDTHRPDLIILDYMQLMSDNGLTPSMTPRMMNLSREIKLLAMSNDIPIVSITAVTDEDGGKRDAPPVLGQVAWSKAIEYDANLAIAIHRHDDSNLVECVGRKNRHGPLFGFYFDVDFDLGIWNEQFDI